MKGISITLEGEEAEFYWRDGKIYCTGYDLESEKAVLALTSFGKGFGVLLIAMNACCKSERSFVAEVKSFVAEYEKMIPSRFGLWPEGPLLFAYFSYSPDSTIRWRGVADACLSERHYKRMLKDPDLGIKIEMARLPRLPEKYFYSLARLSDSNVNYYLTQNEDCPSDLLKILGRDGDVTVRWSVARNLNCPVRMLELLVKDKNDWVRWSVVSNSNCPQRLLGLLLKDANIGLREFAQKKLARGKDLEV